MFIGYDTQNKDIEKIKITKRSGGKDCTKYGAFAFGESVTFSLILPRILGVISASIRLLLDGGEERTVPFSFVESKLGSDEYAAELVFSELCDGDGLFYYDIILECGERRLYILSVNNVDFEVSEREGERFRLLVYASDFSTPSVYYGKTVYHIFVDRFCKGEKAVSVRPDAVINGDWDTGVPQYAKEAGDKLSNNVFFGGTLWGVIEKLDHIKELGADVIYLSPIFEAYSNHKYDTGNYEKVDDMFGGEEAFAELIKEADKRGMRVILDGVFNHSGDDSVYFDKYGRYGNKGAYGDINSPYAEWYTFKNYPNEYECWWGIDIHPRFNHNNRECLDFFVGKNGITEKYVREGIGGWRLDVADELSDEFLENLRRRVKSADPNAIIIGEVWENAADKIAYGKRRKYLRGGQLDSVMNYPLRSAVIDFLRYRDASILSDTLVEIYASYPKCVCDCLLNILGTHDTERIITVLGGMCDEDMLSDGHTNDELAKMSLGKDTKKEAKKLLALAAVIQFTIYGIPSVFYGDEAGLEGYHDPFCRRTYPWGREDKELLELYKKLGNIRREEECLCDGEFSLILSEEAFVAYSRGGDKGLTVLVNRGESEKNFVLEGKYIDILRNKVYNGVVPSNMAYILKKVRSEN